ncbi:alpha/beta hydrolase [Lysobacter capsici]|nr:alpha/beta hydrolase [Lysobacter capsici]WND79839.1 alpha/beta hydrolase [Lysobacter capsici]WND85035.1 alpha/beta hydrolase [Lysobacter capsici]
MRTLWLTGLFLLSGCVLHVSEQNIVQAKPGTAIESGASADGAWTIKALSLPLEPGVVLRGAFFERPGSVATVLYFGGNGFVLSRHYQYVLRIYKDRPVDIVAFDHRGYGGSTGAASLDAMMADGPLLYDYVKTLPTVAPRPLIVHGHSLGSFVAGEVAKQRSLDGLVLESSATSAEQWANGFADASILIRKSVVDSSLAGRGNLSVMATLDEPVLIVSGADDTTTRPEMAKALFEAAAVADTRKVLLVVPGHGHMDASLSAEYVEAFDRLYLTDAHGDSQRN